MKWHNALVVALEIQINREADVPIHERVAAQIVLHIGSGMLRQGDALPSVRALARRLSIHRNTVTQAYRDPVLSKLVVNPDSHFSFDSANHRVASDAFIYAGWKALKALRRSTPNG